jgi:hypothetical protein
VAGAPVVPQPDAALLPLLVTSASDSAAPESTLFVFASSPLSELKRLVAAHFSWRPDVVVGLMRADRKGWTKASALEAFGPKKDLTSLTDLQVQANARFVAVELEADAVGSGVPGSGASGSAAATATPPQAQEAVRRVMDATAVRVKFVQGKALDPPAVVPIDSRKLVSELRVAIAEAVGVEPRGTRLKLYRGLEFQLLAKEDATVKTEKLDGDVMLGIEDGPRPAAGEVYVLFRAAMSAGVWVGWW